MAGDGQIGGMRLMDNVTKAQRSYIMSRIRSVSMAELDIKSAIRGYRLRHQPKGIVGKPDYANKTRKVAIFFNGCYWHQPCPSKCSKMPTSNSTFWKKKFKDNRRRQHEVFRALYFQGWAIGVVWECMPNIIRWRKRLL